MTTAASHVHYVGCHSVSSFISAIVLLCFLSSISFVLYLLLLRALRAIHGIVAWQARELKKLIQRKRGVSIPNVQGWRLSIGKRMREKCRTSLQVSEVVPASVG